jgi:hypothetical protein
MNPQMVSRTRWLVGFEALVSLLTVWWAIRWWTSWTPAVVVAAGAMMAVSAVQWVRLRQLDYGAPVMALLRQLEALQRLRIRSVQVGFVVGSILWLPMVLMALGVPMELLDRRWLLTNMMVTLGVMGPLAIWLGKTKSSVRDDLTGRSLARARDAAAELAAFEIS